MKRGPDYSPYKNDSLRVNDRVVITCAVSKYNDVEGIVFEINRVTGYAIVDMPKGTELRIERIEQNKILSGWKVDKKKPKRRPQGDPQLFPIGWLETIGSVDDSVWFEKKAE